MIDLAVDSYDEGPLLDLADFLPEPTFRDILDRVLETTPAALYKHDGRLASVSRRLLDLDDPKRAFLCALEIRDRYRRVRATHHAAAALRQLPHEELLALWRMASPLSRQSTRQHAFQFAAALGPLAFAVGGDEAIQRLYATIAETSRWWIIEAEVLETSALSDIARTQRILNQQFTVAGRADTPQICSPG